MKERAPPRRLLWIRFLPVLFSVEVIALFRQSSKAAARPFAGVDFSVS